MSDVLVVALLESSDCEILRDGLIAQPVNTLTSLAYVAVGLWAMRQAKTRHGFGWLNAGTLGAALVVLGLGSVGFHGPRWAVASWLHAYSIAGVLIFVLFLDLARLQILKQETAQRAALATAVVAAIFAGARDFGLVLALPVVAAAIVLDLWAYRRDTRQEPRPDGVAARYVASALVLGVAGVLNLLGRTDGPLCSPSSMLQLHGLWHVLTALALGTWASVAFPRRVARPPAPLDSLSSG